MKKIVFGLGLFFIGLALGFNNCSMKPDLAATSSMLNPYPAPIVTSMSPQKVFTGGSTELTIEGQNFKAGLVVSVGGKNCPVTALVGETTVKCRVPIQEAGTQEVVVTNFDGKTARSSVEYDPWALSEVELVVGKLSMFAGNSDGAYNNGDSRGAHQMVHDGVLVYSADFDGWKIKETNLATLYSKTLVGIGRGQWGDDDSPDPTKWNVTSPQCLVKVERKLYFCLEAARNSQLAAYDLDTKSAQIIAGTKTAEYVDDPDPAKVRFYEINRLFSKDGVLYIFERYDSRYLRKFDISKNEFTTIAGCAETNCPKDSQGNVLDYSDGVGREVAIGEIEDGVVLGNSIYYLVEGMGSYGSVLRRYDIAENRFTTLIGNGDGSSKAIVDGDFSVARIQEEVNGLTAMEGKLVLMEKDTDTKNEKPVLLRVIDLEKQTVTTLKSFKFIPYGNASTLGKLDTDFTSEHQRMRGIHYVPSFGLLLGYEMYLLRMF